MIVIKDNVLEKVKKWSASSIYILMDFDRTITKCDSNSSWEIIPNDNCYFHDYIEEREKLTEYYYAKEIDDSIPDSEKSKLMTEWWNKHLHLFIKYRISEDVFNTATSDRDCMSLRSGAKEFFIYMHQKNIPVIIISVGIGNVVKNFLVNNDCYFSNMYIVSNFMEFKDSVVSGFSETIIHSYNKDKVVLDPHVRSLISTRTHIILFGDFISDIKMVPDSQRDNALKIGFLNSNTQLLSSFQKSFDVVCSSNVGYQEIFQKLNILK